MPLSVRVQIFFTNQHFSRRTVAPLHGKQMEAENANMRVTRSRALQMAAKKTGRGALTDISANPQQAKKQAVRKKNVTKAFAVASDDIDIDAMVLSIGDECMEQTKPEWYSPDPQFVSEYMNEIMGCYRRSEVLSPQADECESSDR